MFCDYQNIYLSLRWPQILEPRENGSSIEQGTARGSELPGRPVVPQKVHSHLFLASPQGEKTQVFSQSNSAPNGIWPHLELGEASEEQGRKAEGPLSQVLQMLGTLLTRLSGPGGTLSCHSWKRGSYWLALLGAVQGHCSRSQNVHNSPQDKEWSGPKCQQYQG